MFTAMYNVEFARPQVAVGCECVARYSGRPTAARFFIRQQQQQCSSVSCSADALFFLGTLYLSLGVLRCVFGVRYAVSVLVNNT